MGFPSLSMKTISSLLLRLRKGCLWSHAQSVMFFSSAVMVFTLEAGTIIYVSLAYLHNSLP